MEEKKTYYAIRRRAILSAEIISIYHWSCGRYGSTWIVRELESKEIRASRPFVAKLMRELDLRSIVKKKFKQTTNWLRRTTSLGFISSIPCCQKLFKSKFSG
ncbi:IS3 family transposase [Chryseobacterium sp. G0201]|uniref:IS3 family transposase n=1 Tax=Chryseobacterium sp. G0201 TaxID=2487065 RepID=UPI000F4EF0A5|nr:IS3 family transposase [Chryseobacterium sp. G0201]AZA53973.1 hypothetical protein EG348_13670 [Chryseobacterium sp. G0201]